MVFIIRTLKMKHLRFLTLAACVTLALPACETMEGVKQDFKDLNFSSPVQQGRSEKLLSLGACPHIEIVEELASLHDFTNQTNAQEHDLISSAQMRESSNNCFYENKSVTIDLELAFDGALGQHGRLKDSDKPSLSYPFFVAITDGSGTILAKEIFSVSLVYDPGQNTQTAIEKLRQIIPVPSKQKGASYKVLAGFQLSQDQLAYNRAMIETRKRQEEDAKKAAKAAAVNPAAGGQAVQVLIKDPDNPDAAPIDITGANLEP
jgi:predicted small secreted protein